MTTRLRMAAAVAVVLMAGAGIAYGSSQTMVWGSCPNASWDDETICPGDPGVDEALAYCGEQAGSENEPVSSCVAECINDPCEGGLPIQ